MSFNKRPFVIRVAASLMSFVYTNYRFMHPSLTPTSNLLPLPLNVALSDIDAIPCCSFCNVAYNPYLSIFVYVNCAHFHWTPNPAVTLRYSILALTLHLCAPALARH